MFLKNESSKMPKTMQFHSKMQAYKRTTQKIQRKSFNEEILLCYYQNSSRKQYKILN
jgi:hypothetical protein